MHNAVDQVHGSGSWVHKGRAILGRWILNQQLDFYEARSNKRRWLSDEWLGLKQWRGMLRSNLDHHQTSDGSHQVRQGGGTMW
jgi:hypothetical protein